MLFSQSSIKQICTLLAGLSLATSASAQNSETQRGFGKISPGYQSFYYVRKQMPFYLVDNQGRNAAEILVYVKSAPGEVIQHKIVGTTQNDLKVPLKVVVTNMTRDCAVSVEWLAFDFREDGEPSSKVMGTPPGANPNTTVPAGGTYVHTFHFAAVTTFKNGKPVLNEVLPSMTLQCSANAVNNAGRSASLVDKAGARAIEKRGSPTAEASKEISAISGRGLKTFDTTSYSRLEETVSSKLEGCSWTVLRRETSTTLADARNQIRILDHESTLNLSTITEIKDGPMNPRGGTVYVTSSETIQRQIMSFPGGDIPTNDRSYGREEEQFSLYFETVEAAGVASKFLRQAAKACGAKI